MIKVGERIDRVLKMTLQGHSEKEIAETMRVSENTVKGYRRRLYRYFNVVTKGDLIEKLGHG